MTIFGEILFWAIFAALCISFIWIMHNATDCRWWVHIWWSPVNVIISGLITIIILVIIFSCTYTISYENPMSKHEVEIYSIGIGAKYDVNGTFMLGTGTINGSSVPTYRFYTLTEDRYKLVEVNANNFDIVCTDTVIPKIVIDATELIEEPNHRLVFNDTIHKSLEKEKWHGTIYIPKNSIVQSYNIQL